jgi:transketolase
MRNAFIRTLVEAAESNPKIWLVCGDLGFSVLEIFATRFPERFINAGVAEQNMAGVAAGLGLSNCTPFVYSIANFPTVRCLEQIRNDVCYHGADVKIVALGSGLAYGSHGYTHHAVEDLAVMTSLPRMEVFVPCDPVEVASITKHITESGRPSYLRLGRAGEPTLSPEHPADPYAPRLLRKGGDITVLVSGPIAALCLQAAAELERSGLDVGVVSVPCLKPFPDEFLMEATRRARVIVTVEEHILRGGLYSAVANRLAAETRHAPVVGIAIPEVIGHAVAGSREHLLELVGLSTSGIAESIRKAAAHVRAA